MRFHFGGVAPFNSVAVFMETFSSFVKVRFQIVAFTIKTFADIDWFERFKCRGF